MTDDELLRYSRHILLADIGIEGQARIGAAQVLVVGAGGLGSPVAMYLAAAGVGRLTIADGDHVDLTNLQRQIVHDSASVGRAKAESAVATMRALNPGGEAVAVVERLGGEALALQVAAADVVVDCSDNFATRQALNAACVRHARPLVAGSAVGFDGQLSVHDARRADSPCYACIFAPDSAAEDVACSVLGVFAPLVGVIGSLQAAEALKLVAGIGVPLVGRLLLFDARRTAWTELAVAREPACPVCGHGAAEEPPRLS